MIEIKNNVRDAYKKIDLEKLKALSLSLTFSDRINIIAKQIEHKIASIFPLVRLLDKLKS